MELFKIREAFDRSGVMICFNGPFSHSIIDEIGVAVRNHLSAQNLTQAAVLDVFAIFVELAQNVKNYCAFRAIPSKEARSAIITIARQDETYIVSSGNAVLKDDLPRLVEKIDIINAQDGPGLRKLYKEQMRRQRPPDAVGAGLGLMEIAKRATAKMTYTVTDMEEGLAFFCLTARV